MKRNICNKLELIVLKITPKISLINVLSHSRNIVILLPLPSVALIKNVLQVIRILLILVLNPKSGIAGDILMSKDR